MSSQVNARKKFYLTLYNGMLEQTHLQEMNCSPIFDYCK